MLAFQGGLLIGAVLTVLVLSVAGTLVRSPLPVPVRWGLVALILIPVLLKETGAVVWRFPENRRLVPESVFRLGPVLGPLQFGIEMGTGARTYLPSALPYAAAAAVMLVAPLPAALLTGAGFALGRAVMTAATVHYAGDWHAEWSRYPVARGALILVAFLSSLVGAAA